MVRMVKQIIRSILKITKRTKMINLLWHSLGLVICCHLLDCGQYFQSPVNMMTIPVSLKQRISQSRYLKEEQILFR